MVLPLLFSLGLPALAGTGALGATMATLSVPALAGMGAGLGSFVQTGDLGKGIQTGMASFLGGKVLGGLSGSTSPQALNTGTGAQAAQTATPGFLQAGTPVSTIAKAPVAADSLATKFLGSEAAGTKLGFGNTGATKGGAFTAAQQGFIPGMIGQTMTDAQLMQQEYENRAAKKDDDSTVPMPNPMQRTYNPDPYAGGGGEGSYFQYARPPRADGSEVKPPYYYAEGGYVNTNGPIDRSQLTGKGAGRTATQNPNETYINMLSVPRDSPHHEQQDYYGEMMGLERGRHTSYPLTPPMQGQTRPLQQYSQYLGKTYDNFDQKRNMFLSDVREQEQKTFGQRQGRQNIFGMNQDSLQYEPFLGQFGEDFSGISGIAAFREGGEVEADQMMAQNGMNEKDVIVSAIEAIKGMSEQPEIVLALFVQKYGEDALRDLVGRVQSGELDDTVDRFESGDKGMVRGPGDGSGVDDMVPATLEGEQDVLLSDGEFVLREKTTDALEKAYGGGFLDMVNRAEEDAPKKLQQMVG